MGVLDALYEAFGDRRVEPEPPPRIKSVEERDGVTIVRLQGRVGMSLGAEATSVETRLNGGEGARERPVIIDFAGTREIDFTTLAVLVHALRDRDRTQARIGIINAPPKLRAEIDMAKLGKLLPVFGSEHEAVRALTARGRRRFSLFPRAAG
jgi:anti-anti-sigma regulatory factor